MAASEALTNKERRQARKAEREAERAKIDANVSKKRTSPDTEQATDVMPGQDDEPLSHKELRKRRKMEKRSGDIDADEHQLSAAPERLQRSPYSVWIGNLSFTTPPDQLTEWLAEHGIQGVSRVHMPQGARRSEHNKGFAYVDLESEDQVDAAVALSENQLGGRRLLIKNGTDFRGRPGIDPTALGATGHAGLTKTAQKILHAQRNPAGPTLFMGNLSFETTEEAIRELLDGSMQRRHFQQLKDDDDDDDEEQEPTPESLNAGIRKIRMGTFEDSGKCKGFAFVDFNSTNQATQALLEPRNGRLLGRTLLLEFAGTDAVRRGASRNLLPDFTHTPRRRRPARDAADEAPGEEDGEAKWPERETLDSQLEAFQTTDAGAGASAPTRPRRKDTHHRVRPGAANAQAARQQYGILPSAGKRTTFE